MRTRDYGPLTAAARALQAAGYDLSANSDEDRLILSVSDNDDDDADATLAEIRGLVEPLGCTADWTGDSNTDADGYTTSDVCIEFAITDAQIRALRDKALADGDTALRILCDMALDGEDSEFDDECLDYEGRPDYSGGGYAAAELRAIEHSLRLTQDEARAECARIIAEALAKDSER